MPSFTVKVPNDDEGEDLGEYESAYLPRVGDPFSLWHPRVCEHKDVPFLGVVHEVSHEAYCPDPGEKVGSVHTTVWLIEEHAPPARYCDCSPDERAKYAVKDGLCENCRGQRTA
jgi:hypothetical protein